MKCHFIYTKTIFLLFLNFLKCIFKRNLVKYLNYSILCFFYFHFKFQLHYKGIKNKNKKSDRKHLKALNLNNTTLLNKNLHSTSSISIQTHKM